jgi:hypothetical protein
MYELIEGFVDDPAFTATATTLGNGSPGIRLRYSTTTLRLSIAEAVELVDTVVNALTQIPEDRELRRNETAVRSDAEIREGL